MSGSAHRLVLSRHVSFLSLSADLWLCGHAFLGPRCVVEADVLSLLRGLSTPVEPARWAAEQAGEDLALREAYEAFLADMEHKGVLVRHDPSRDEDDALRARFGPDVESATAAELRHKRREAIDPRVRPRLRPLRAPGAAEHALRAVYIGCCMVLSSVDALIELGAAQGVRVRAVGTFPSDLALIDEERPDFVVLGDVRRTGLGFGDTREITYADALRALVRQVRARSACPILVRNLPGPTCAPLGLADRGGESHINKVRRINIEIAELAAEFVDVHVVDIDQALALRGRAGLVDDMVALSHHLGSLTWLAEQAQRDRSALAALLPDPSQLLSIDAPRERLEMERLMAAEDLLLMRTILGIGRRKCLVVDLDNTLWPGVLAETGHPFPPDLPVDVYPHHLFLGLHEALLALRARGVLLACVSKNDEEVVRALWRYPAALAGLPALQLQDFVTHRINWRDKVDNILDIAAELGLGLDSLAFLDDHPHERERVRQRLPQVMVLGDNPYAARWQLLTDPAFQVPAITDESRRRSEMVRGQLDRQREMAAAGEGAAAAAAFLASLQLRCRVRRETEDGALDRIAELLLRTNQLNTTGARLSKGELRRFLDEPATPRNIYTLHAADRFADYGLVGACIADGATVVLLALSCRVIGLGLEDLLLRAAVRDMLRRTGAAQVIGVLVRTARNQPARRLFGDNGFLPDPIDGTRFVLSAAALPDTPEAAHYALSLEGLRVP